jgi:hypothetical protein
MHCTPRDRQEVYERTASMSATADQLWYTASPVGLQTTGFQVRAASPGLRDLNAPRFRRLERLLPYQGPTSQGTSIRPDEAPVSLALLKIGEEYILLHKAFVALTWDNRPGNFFTHVLAGLPNDFSASNAIETWESAKWSRSDTLDRRTFDLPLIDPNVFRADPLTCADLSKITREQLAFVVRAFLQLGPAQRLFLAAPAPVVATLIWGLTRCLPRALTRTLTFSTYERDVTAANAPLLVGTAAAPGQADQAAGLLPPACYEGAGLALNMYARKASNLSNEDPRVVAYTQYAIDQLFGPNMQELTKLLAITERHIALGTMQEKQEQLATLLTIYRFSAAGSGSRRASEADISDLLQLPSLAADLIGTESIQQELVRLVADVSGWWPQYGQPGIRKLRALADKPSAAPELRQALRSIAKQAEERAREMIQLSGQRRAEILLDGLLATADPQYASEAWLALLEQLPPPDVHGYTGAIRLWLLERWTGLRLNVQQHQAMRRWLNLPWDEIGQVLGTKLPPTWAQSALILAIRRADAPSGVAWMLRGRLPLVRATIAQLMQSQDPLDRDHLAQFYQALVWNQDPEVSVLPGTEAQLLMQDLLLKAPHDINFVEQILKCSRLDSSFIDLLKRQPILLTNLSQRRTILQYLVDYVDDMTIAKARHARAELKMIAGIRENLGSTAVDVAAQRFVTVLDFLDRPSCEEQVLSQLASALRGLRGEQLDDPSTWLIEPLARVIDSAPHLYTAIATVGQAIVQSRSYSAEQPIADGQRWWLYELLFTHTWKHHRKLGSRVAPYIEIALDRDPDYRLPLGYYNWVTQAILRSPATIDALNRPPHVWSSSDAHANWQRFLRNSQAARLDGDSGGAIDKLWSWMRGRLPFLILILVFVVAGVAILITGSFPGLLSWAAPKPESTPTLPITTTFLQGEAALPQPASAYDAPNGKVIGPLTAGQPYRAIARAGKEWLQINVRPPGKNEVWVRAAEAGLSVDPTLPDRTLPATAESPQPTKPVTPAAESATVASSDSGAGAPTAETPPSAVPTAKPSAIATPTRIATQSPTIKPTSSSKPAQAATASTTSTAVPSPGPTSTPTIYTLERSVKAYGAPDGNLIGSLEPGVEYIIIDRSGSEWLYIEAAPPTNRVWIRAADAGVPIDPAPPKP